MDTPVKGVNKAKKNFVFVYEKKIYIQQLLNIYIIISLLLYLYKNLSIIIYRAEIGRVYIAKKYFLYAPSLWTSDIETFTDWFSVNIIINNQKDCTVREKKSRNRYYFSVCAFTNVFNFFRINVGKNLGNNINKTICNYDYTKHNE